MLPSFEVEVLLLRSPGKARIAGENWHGRKKNLVQQLADQQWRSLSAGAAAIDDLHKKHQCGINCGNPLWHMQAERDTIYAIVLDKSA